MSSIRVVIVTASLLASLLSLVSASGLYGIVGLPSHFGTIDTTSGAYKNIADLEPYEPAASSNDVLTVDKNGIFYTNLDDKTRTPYFVSVTPSGKVDAVKLNLTCFLWNLVYDGFDDKFYGVVITSSSAADLYTISKTGALHLIGNFPLSVKAKKLDEPDTTCYINIGGGAGLDPLKKVLYTYYSAGDKGMYFQTVDLATAKVLTHSYFEHDLVVPVLTPDMEGVYSLTIEETPPYTKYLSYVDLNTGNYKRMPNNVEGYATYWLNEGALKYSTQMEGTYFAAMAVNATAPIQTIVGLDIQSGLVNFHAPAPYQVVWNMLYVNN